MTRDQKQVLKAFAVLFCFKAAIYVSIAYSAKKAREALR